MTQPVSSQPMRRVEDWKSRLIDLSKRNNLIYFHKAKRGSLPISQPDMQTIFNALVIKKRRLEFWLPPGDSEKPEQSGRTKGKGKAKTAKTNVKAAVKEGIQSAVPDEPKQRPTASQLVSGNLARADLERNLKSLQWRSLLD